MDIETLREENEIDTLLQRVYKDSWGKSKSNIREFFEAQIKVLRLNRRIISRISNVKKVFCLAETQKEHLQFDLSDFLNILHIDDFTEKELFEFCVDQQILIFYISFPFTYDAPPTVFGAGDHQSRRITDLLFTEKCRHCLLILKPLLSEIVKYFNPIFFIPFTKSIRTLWKIYLPEARVPYIHCLNK